MIRDENTRIRGNVSEVLAPDKMQIFTFRRVAIAAALLAAFDPAYSATVTWTGPNSSFWDLATNWSTALPTAADDVQLGAANTVFRSGSVSVASILGTGQLTINGGNLQYSAGSSIDTFTQTQGSLGGSGNFTVTGPATLTLGDHRGSGITILQGTS